MVSYLWTLSLLVVLHLTIFPHGEGMSLDQIIVESENATTGRGDILFDAHTNLLKVELDMVFTIDEFVAREKALKAARSNSRKKRTAALRVNEWGAKRWTNNKVYFQVSVSDFSNKDISEIFSAIDEWKKHTCISFVQSTSAKNRIQFTRGTGGCYSRLGMVGGIQIIGLSQYCPNKKIVIHEIGHALGLQHEQNRPDRDNYVTIIKENINSKMMSNFEVSTWEFVEYLGIPYDYRSIMHYGKMAFTMNGKDTIRTIDSAYTDVIGNAEGLSFGDIKTMNIMYNCKRHTPGCNLDDDQCPGSGFVGKDCLCLCPGDSTEQPTKQCAGTVKPKPTTTTTQKPTGIVCEDQNINCSRWASIGECDKNKKWMHPHCTKSCGLCNYGDCMDTNINCARWASTGECNKNKGWMLKNCQKSCAVCYSPAITRPTAATTTTAKPSGGSGGCVDLNSKCSRWASNGDCDTDQRYMQKSCRKSCNLCNVPVTPTKKVVPAAKCEDNHEACTKWGRTGYCTGRYKKTIQPLCHLSCGLC